MIGQVAAFVEANKLGQSLDRFYKHLDSVIGAGGHTDPFEPAYVATPEQRKTVSDVCARLHGEGFDPAIVEKLAMHLLASPDGVVGTLRPYELADAWGADRAQVLDVMMHAAHEGLLEATWDVVCPKCLLAHESLRELAQVTRVGTCKACASSFERDLRESVELARSLRIRASASSNARPTARAPPRFVRTSSRSRCSTPARSEAITLDLPRGTYRIAGGIAKMTAELVLERRRLRDDGDGEHERRAHRRTTEHRARGEGHRGPAQRERARGDDLASRCPERASTACRPRPR